jgi:4-diphosphocytidyl-2-C-methyl-D-erythritol kinase
MTDSFSIDCPAKVNLFFRILAREADGYHGVETLLCRVALADELLVERTASGIDLEVVGAELGAPEQNLVWRAAEAVLAATGSRFGVRFKLTKRIPIGAGLGGGSSDAAAALLAVNRLANHAMPLAELMHLAAGLGADIPFFCAEASLALAWGHGQRLLRLNPLPARPILVVAAKRPVATADAYRWIDEGGDNLRRGSVVLDTNLLGDWGNIARMGGNDFETAIFTRYPEIRSGYEAVAGTHPLLCRMTGSGSALFAVYRNERDRDDAAMMLGSKHGTVFRSATT